MTPEDRRERARSIRNDAASEATDDDVAFLKDLLSDDRRLALNALRVVAAHQPDRFRSAFPDVAPILSLRDAPDATVRADAADLLSRTIEPEADPDDVGERLAALAALLDDEAGLVRRTALEGADRATTVAPETAPALADAVAPFLDREGESRRRAADVIARAATVDGESIADYAPRLVELCRTGDGYGQQDVATATAAARGADDAATERIRKTDGDRWKRHRTVRGRAAYAIRQLAVTDPDALLDDMDGLAAALEEADSTTRRPLAETFLVLARHRPSAVASHRRALGDAIAEGSPAAADRATRALAVLGMTEPAVADVARERVDALGERLESEEAPVRGASATLLALAADADPEAIAPAEPALAELLTDEDDAVRVAAADALRAAETDHDGGPRRAPE